MTGFRGLFSTPLVSPFVGRVDVDDVNVGRGKRFSCAQFSEANDGKGGLCHGAVLLRAEIGVPCISSSSLNPYSTVRPQARPRRLRKAPLQPLQDRIKPRRSAEPMRKNSRCLYLLERLHYVCLAQCVRAKQGERGKGAPSNLFFGQAVFKEQGFYEVMVIKQHVRKKVRVAKDVYQAFERVSLLSGSSAERLSSLSSATSFVQRCLRPRQARAPRLTTQRPCQRTILTAFH